MIAWLSFASASNARVLERATVAHASSFLGHGSFFYRVATRPAHIRIIVCSGLTAAAIGRMYGNQKVQIHSKVKEQGIAVMIRIGN